jgi:hypothetical protein
MIKRYNSNHLEVSQAINKQAGNFMIDRFGPTVKAMICETPQYASKKPLIGQEQQKKIYGKLGVQKGP